MLTNHARALYTGVTNDLERRVEEHKAKRIPGFTSKYCIDQLVWYEEFQDVRDAIAYEKRIKGWTRAKKVALIEESNPRWENLSAGWQ